MAASGDLAQQVIERLRFDEAGLIPAIAQSHETREVLMLAWMNAASVRETLATGRVCYWSRSRQRLWRKGESSGHTQRLVEMRFDCDSDAPASAGRPDRPRLPHKPPRVLLPCRAGRRDPRDRRARRLTQRRRPGPSRAAVMPCAATASGSGSPLASAAVASPSAGAVMMPAPPWPATQKKPGAARSKPAIGCRSATKLRRPAHLLRMCGSQGPSPA